MSPAQPVATEPPPPDGIPHGAPVRFELAPGAAPLLGTVRLPETHPLRGPAGYPTLALVELAAQLAGRALSATLEQTCDPTRDPGPRAGMLVELDEVTLKRTLLPAATLVSYRITPGRSMGSLHRFFVEFQDLMTVSLTLRIS